RASNQSKRGPQTDRSEGLKPIEARASNRSKRGLRCMSDRVHFNLSCAVLATNEAIPVCIGDCFLLRSSQSQ
ncbi:MAG: hypothetical protein LBJ01_11140, partial [Tannerella sp.]|nr:hypothetical protein [Tannerella sp.]